MFVGEIGILRLELPDLAVGAPLSVAGPRVPQVSRRNPVETARRVESRGELRGERLDVHETVRTRRSDGLFVQTHRIEFSALDSRDPRGHQGGAVLEVLGALSGTGIEPPTMCRQCFQMRLTFDPRLRITGGRAGERTVELEFSTVDQKWCCPEQTLASQRRIESRDEVSGHETGLQLANPVLTLEDGEMRLG